MGVGMRRLLRWLFGRKKGPAVISSVRGMEMENPGPEYDAYLMRGIAEDLSKLDDTDLAPAIEEIGQTTSLLIDRMREFQRKKVA